jgi:hypothetical protein
MTDQQIKDKAQEMLEELESNRLEVFLIPDCYDETRNSRRVVISQNAAWYRQFCAEYPSRRRLKKAKIDTIIKRKHTINGLNRVIAGDRKTIYAKRLIQFMGEQTMVTFEHEDKYKDSALTLYPESIGMNDSGWLITGEIKDDYFEWVNDFEAVHSQFGRVWGDYEHTIYADNQEGLDHFLKNHPPHSWDYADI